jgi:hypothetical protein
MNIRQLLFVVFIFTVSVCYPQKKQTVNCMNVYLFSGQGSDQRLFKNLKFEENYNLIPVCYSVPERNISLNKYARLLSQQIDTSHPFVLIGVSLGGMICSELSNILHPEKVIIISSAKCRDELPVRYKFMKYFPVYKIIPEGILKRGAFIAQPMFEPDRNNEKEVCKAMLQAKDPKFLKRTTGMIVNWDLLNYSSKIIHIHGNNDHTLPYRKTKADYMIKNGSHMMTLTRSKEISSVINMILSE